MRCRQQSLQRCGQTSYHRILCGSRFDSNEYRIETEARVSSDAQLSDVRRNVGEAVVQHFNTAIPGSSISGAEFDIPEIG
jgi:hypothetical protein